MTKTKLFSSSNVGLLGWTTVAILGLGGLGLVRGQSELPHAERFAASLADRPRVLWLGAGSKPWSVAQGLEWQEPSSALVSLPRAACASNLLQTQLQEARLDAVLVERSSDSSDRALSVLRGNASCRGLRALVMSEELTLFEIEEPSEIPPAAKDVLSVVARGILMGAEAPDVQSFPASLRAVRDVEIMVMISSQGSPLLWRSARGNSIAQALLLASQVARQRWNERSFSFGRVDQTLPTMEVSVHRLMHDGVLLSREPSFLREALSQEHGVAYEGRGAWKYLLPNATREKGDALQAYAALFAESGMPEDSYRNEDITLYRLRVEDLSVSAPQPVDP